MSLVFEATFPGSRGTLCIDEEGFEGSRQASSRDREQSLSLHRHFPLELELHFPPKLS